MTKDDAAADSTPVATSGAAGGDIPNSADHVIDSIEDKAATARLNNDSSDRNAQPQTNGNTAEDDSEAETDIEPGRVVGPRSASRKIKHEANDASTNGHDKSNGVSDSKQKAADDAPEKPSGGNSNSSILTSVVSSPSQINDESSRAGSAESPHSPSKTSVDSDTLARNTAKRKRDEEGNGIDQKRRIKRESSPDGEASVKKRRSNSPHVRQRRRTFSTQSAANDQGSKSSRRKPAPIRTGRDAGRDVDADYDSDDSTISHHRHRKSTTASHQHNASTSRKMPPTINTFKYRDRNGRTLLAKACYTDSVDVVRERLEENPGHLDEREYADNTPLQIAALRGDAKIVKFLIDRGANVHTQNHIKDTPLIDAVENSNFEVVKLLLDAGVNPSQPNAKGEEPLELIPEDEDDEEITNEGKRIRAAVLEAKKKWKTRRPSEPNDPLPTSSRRSTAAQSPRGSPSYTTLARNVSDTGSGRRAPRGASTRNDLLWISPTPQRLRKAAGEGDAEATSHLLSMGQTADSQAVLAAAKGCHQACLELLLAMGSPEIDPDPIPGLKPGWDTPLLAAIGQSGENLGIIETLLGQAGFNPTRKLFQGKTYYEIAKDRAGSNMQAEYDMLKKAYDTFVRKHGSPKSGRTSGLVKRKKLPDADSSKPAKQNQSEQRRDGDAKVKRPSDALPRRKGSNERPSSSGSHLQVPQKLKSRESSVAISDRADSPSRQHKKRRISSSSDDDKKNLPKQRKRLLTGKERREGEERKRRSSITSVDSASSAIRRNNGELKKSKMRASVSPVREKKIAPERKSSDTTNAPGVKRKPKSEQQAEKPPLNDFSNGSAKSSQKGKHPSKPAVDSVCDSTSVAPTAPMGGSSSTDADEDSKKRKRLEDDASRNEEEQKRREAETAERKRKAEAERLAEAERQEAERLRKEKEDEERAKKEEAERVQRELQAQEERERKEKELQERKQRKLDLERLPEGLFHALHEHASPPTPEQQRMWCPLRAISAERLGSFCPDTKQHSDEDTKWLLNFQVAILLGLKDWSLAGAEFESWPRVSMPTYLAAPVSSWWTSYFATRKSLAEESEEQYWVRTASNRAKFVKLASESQFSLFWVRADDFAKAVARYPHLTEIKNEKGDLRIQLCGFSPKLKPPSDGNTTNEEVSAT